MNKKVTLSTVTASSTPIITENSTFDPETIFQTKNSVPTVLTKPTKLPTRSSQCNPIKPKRLIAAGAVSISSKNKIKSITVSISAIVNHDSCDPTI